MTTARLPRPKCRCVAKVDRLLKEKHTTVETTLFTGMVAVRTSLTHDAPKRTRAVIVIASFCPFCGVQYPLDYRLRPQHPTSRTRPVARCPPPPARAPRGAPPPTPGSDTPKSKPKKVQAASSTRKTRGRKEA